MDDRRRARSVIWAPWLLAAATLSGLVAALVGGAAWAPASWLALVAPISAAAQRIWRTRSGRR